MATGSETTRMMIDIVPATAARWKDLEGLFGARGACGGCWCMAWRKTKKEFDRDKGEANRKSLQALVKGGREPGLLAYADGEAVGWVAVAPREEYPRLGGSRVLAPVDDRPVWSVSCLFVRKGWRRRGLSVQLLEAAAEHAYARGAAIVEGYPVEVREGKLPDPFVWTGLLPAYLRAGYREAARRSPTRPIVRKCRKEDGQRGRRAEIKG
jgi:GNAT superfamily N-acetyltransferase